LEQLSRRPHGAVALDGDDADGPGRERDALA
jgi:hypothetical protein